MRNTFRVLTSGCCRDGGDRGGPVLRAEDPQGGDDARSGRLRCDDRVELAAGDGQIGVDVLAGVLLDELALDFVHVAALLGGGLELAPPGDGHGPFGSQDGDLRAGPGEVEVSAQGLRAHDDVGAAVGFAQHDGHERDGGVRVGPDELGPAPDDARLLLLGAGPVSRDVHQRDDGDVEGVAELDEAPGLLGRVDVEGPGLAQGLVGDDADGLAVHAGEAHDDRRGEELLHLDEFAVVDDRADDVGHVVGLFGRLGDEGA